MKTQDQIIEELEATIAQAKAQIKQLKQPKITYLMQFKNSYNQILKFTDLIQTEPVYNNACPKYDHYIPHTNAEIWTQIPEFVKQWKPQSNDIKNLINKPNSGEVTL
jgi:uncharacterized coiled-coil protein SlyX